MPKSATINDLDARGHGLRVLFEQTGDRFAHRVEASTRGGWTTLLRSPQDATACVPAFQEAHQQDIEGVGPVVFLTGASSGAYWSASVQPSLNGSTRGVHFDISCRRTSDAAGAAVGFAAPRATVLRTAADLLEAETDGVRWSLAVEESSPRAYLTDWASPTIACDPSAAADKPCVLRWRFRVRIE